MKNPFLILLIVTIFISCSQTPNANLDVSELTISEIHQAYKNGTFTSEQLVQAYMDRIEAVDQKVNAITIINPDARKRAKALDDEFKETGKLRPLHGIPVIVKDNINTEGLPTTAGSLTLQNYVPNQDAFIGILHRFFFIDI